MTIHLSPHVLPDLGATAANNSATSTAGNPRCMRRYLSGYMLRTRASSPNTTDLIRDNDNIERFRRGTE
ncbi:tyrosinase central domain-containing protein [Colletotrichum truncatum]|uniref:Tyrosinase central domain-containing protein n=1 Tax=Colletotrichum truncatum TaxID=5467 RepID=A0ACC3YII9_COLTU|nr:tyrosinase central domain-containing protein [Colletotrichum truncatum]KAF6794427.1 tyrosinase central domain-containing protein [Colletotrichum truncatum]